jgi:DNA repair exonuclease SbcCD nuclease subunit
MSGNTIGYVKANYTKRLLDDLAEELEIDRKRMQVEIKSNKLVWSIMLERIRELDEKGFDEWFDKSIPDYVIWTGNEFQETLRIVWEKIKNFSSK